MFISKKHLDRRTFLRGAMGASIALPLLDAMIPAATAQSLTAARPRYRFGAVYVPNGIYPDMWHPKETGRDFHWDAAYATDLASATVQITGNDQAFYAPPELITAMYTALAHYHFHANRHDNAAFAGPGGGDLAFADRFGAACVVFTFIDRDTLNVDYHHEGGVVIDLGCISRPQ